MDYYIRLIFPILFTLLKIYSEGNPDYEIVKGMRDIKLKNLTPGDLIPSLTKVISY